MLTHWDKDWETGDEQNLLQNAEVRAFFYIPIAKSEIRVGTGPNDCEIAYFIVGRLGLKEIRPLSVESTQAFRLALKRLSLRQLAFAAEVVDIQTLATSKVTKAGDSPTSSKNDPERGLRDNENEDVTELEPFLPRGEIQPEITMLSWSSDIERAFE